MPSLNTVHFLTWPTAETYLCGADAVGRRNTARDTNHWNTSCVKCLTKRTPSHRRRPSKQTIAKHQMPRRDKPAGHLFSRTEDCGWILGVLRPVEYCAMGCAASGIFVV